MANEKDTRTVLDKLEDVATFGASSMQKNREKDEANEEEMIDKEYGKEMGNKFRSINRGYTGRG